MKELSIEEKAKAYDEAFERVRSLSCSSEYEGYKKIFENIFPELAESEDEKIRKALINTIKELADEAYVEDGTGGDFWAGDYNSEEIIAWLEKQGEQKPEWSEEDETTKNNISHIIRQYDKISKRENQPCWYIGDCLLWMQNIKDRVQPRQERSEEDEQVIEDDEIWLDNFCDYL